MQFLDSPTGCERGKVADMLRRLIRWFLVVICVGFVLAVIFGVGGAFFIEWAREKGWYENPSQKVDTAMSALAAIVDSGWFIAAGCAVVGLTVGVWLDVFLRRRSQAPIGSDKAADTELTAKADLVIDSSFKYRLNEKKEEIIAYFDGLLKQVDDAEQKFRKDNISQTEFDETIEIIKAKRNGGILQYIDDDNDIISASTLIQNGSKLISRFRGMIYGNFSPGGRFLSTDHSMILATIQNNKEIVRTIISQAVMRIEYSRDTILRKMYQETHQPMLVPFDSPRSPYIFQRGYGEIDFIITPKGPQDDFAVNCLITNGNETGDAVVFGQIAKAVFYLNATARWEWETEVRIAEQRSLTPGEKIEIDVLRRPASGEDRIHAFGKDIVLESSSGASNLFMIKVRFVLGANKHEERKIYQFTPLNSGKISLPVPENDVAYVEGQQDGADL